MADDYRFNHVTEEGQRGFFAGQWLRVHAIKRPPNGENEPDPDGVTEPDPDGVSDPEPPNVFILLGSVEGRIVCTGIAVGGSVPMTSEPAEITSRSLRKIPIRRLVDAYVDESNSSSLPPLQAELVDAMRQRAVPRRQIEFARRGRPGYSREEHEQFANDYRLACAIRSHAPIKYLAREVWTVAERTARGRVNNLRKKGFLGPAPPGRAGEMDVPNG